MTETKKSTAYVICMNDHIRHVVLDNQSLAKSKLIEFKEEYFKRSHAQDRVSREHYENVCYWHIHEVSVE